MTYSQWFGVSKHLITATMIDALSVDYYGRIPITFYGVVATNAPSQEIRPFKPSGYISNDNTLLTLWLNFSVTVSNDGSRVIPSPNRFGPHPLNQFTILCLAHMLLNQRLDGTNSFMAAFLLPSRKMSYNYISRTDDLEPSLHLTN
jgi:hypothetical protein